MLWFFLVGSTAWRAIVSQLPTLRPADFSFAPKSLGKRLADNPRSTLEDFAAHEGFASSTSPA